MDAKMFLLGLTLGMVGGALIIANNKQARSMVKESQEQIRKKARELSKCKCCDSEEED